MGYYDSIAKDRRTEAESHKAILMVTLPKESADKLAELVGQMSLEQVRLMRTWIEYEALAMSQERYARSRP